MNAVFDEEEGRALRLRDSREKALSLLMIASLGKGMKTFQAISRLCVLGYGEDALVLLRANINLMINTAYILSAPDSVDRAEDFMAYSYLERLKYLRIGHGVDQSPWNPTLIPEEEMKTRAERWNQVKIPERAKAVPLFHYDQGYRLYSSFEHSDAFALNDYIQWDETGAKIQLAKGTNM